LTIDGVRVEMALTTLVLSVVEKAEEEVVSEVAVLMALTRLDSAVSRGSAWKMDPLKAFTSLSRVEMSELMVLRSDRTVAASLLLMGTANTAEMPRTAVTIALKRSIMEDGEYWQNLIC